ncbi:hypothetical protein ACP179_16640 [Xenorhabdus stockiae]|uniref:hypothetical protein n=1 Tax=Xenorhabdus stockiae TaxID=351614 RepID=UPI003CF376FD
MFALNFLISWWKVVHRQNSFLLAALYGSENHSLLNPAGCQNTEDDLMTGKGGVVYCFVDDLAGCTGPRFE